MLFHFCIQSGQVILKSNAFMRGKRKAFFFFHSITHIFSVWWKSEWLVIPYRTLFLNMACLFLAGHVDEHTVLLWRDFNKHQEIILRPQLHVRIFILSSLLHVYMAAFILTPTSRAVTSEQILCVALYVLENRCYIFFLHQRWGTYEYTHITDTLQKKAPSAPPTAVQLSLHDFYISSWLVHKLNSEWTYAELKEPTQTSRINEYISMDFSRLTGSHLCGFF